MIAVLGRRDQPTDGVEDYCNLLGQALAARGYGLEVVRVSWLTNGPLRSLHQLWQTLREQQGRWVLVQYTALAWSRHGFPWLFVVLLWLLRIRQTRIAIVFHDAAPYQGHRLVDRVRRLFQYLVMRYAYKFAEQSVVNVPLKQVAWLPRDHSKVTFIPIGSNIPTVAGYSPQAPRYRDAKVIAVFCISANGHSDSEVADIAYVARAASEVIPRLKLIVLGRGSKESEARFRHMLEGHPVDYRALGILPDNKAAEVLANSDVALFVRGRISTQRGSAIASINCGLPVVAYGDSFLPAPLAEAGVVSVNWGDREALAKATINILTDRRLWLELHQRSQACQKYFSWDVIASQFAAALTDEKR